MQEHTSTLATFLSVQLCVLSGGGDKQEGSELHLSVRESGFSEHPVTGMQTKLCCSERVPVGRDLRREGLTPGLQA